jgi:hypothetical protein
MRKMIIITLFLALFQVICAPPLREAVICHPEEINVFDPILYAFQSVESSFRPDVINHLGYAGILQEGPEMIAEANRICKLRGRPEIFTYPESALNHAQAVKIWYIVQGYWNQSYEIKKACKIWNPLGSKKYYTKIQEVLSN